MHLISHEYGAWVAQVPRFCGLFVQTSGRENAWVHQRVEFQSNFHQEEIQSFAHHLEHCRQSGRPCDHFESEADVLTPRKTLGGTLDLLHIIFIVESLEMYHIKQELILEVQQVPPLLQILHFLSLAHKFLHVLSLQDQNKGPAPHGLTLALF